MNKTILVTCGILNALFAAFHVLLGFNIQRMPSLAPEYRALMQCFNTGGTLMIMFLAFAFLACCNQIQTKLGRAAVLLGVALYVTRGLGEFVFFPHARTGIVLVCLVASIAHLFALRVSYLKRPIQAAN